MSSPRRPVLLAALTVAALAAPAAFSADIRLADYRDLVGRARDAAQQKRLSPDRAAELARDLRAVDGVTLPDGQRVAVSLQSEADEFARIARAPSGGRPPETVAQRLAALSDQLTARRSPAAEKVGDPAKLASAILAEDQFRIEKPDADKPRAKWWEKILEAIGKALERFFRWLFGNRRAPNTPATGWQGVGDAIRFTIYFLATVAATVAVYFLARWGTRELARRRGRLKDEPGGPTGLDLTDEGITDPLGAARDLAGRGEYRGAIRLVYIASLQRLATNGLLVLEQNRTNWEYQRALRAESPDAYGALLPSTRLFDRVWYGKMTGSAAEYEAAVAAYERLGSFASAAGANVPLDRVAASPQSSQAQVHSSGSSGVPGSGGAISSPDSRSESGEEIAPPARNDAASPSSTTPPRAEGATRSNGTLAPAAEAKEKTDEKGSNPW